MCDFGEIEREKKCVYVCVNEKERLLIVAGRRTCEDKTCVKKYSSVVRYAASQCSDAAWASVVSEVLSDPKRSFATSINFFI